MHEILEAAKKNLEMNALVRLLYDFAGRIQDAIDISFGSITKAKKKGKGREVHLHAKKTSARDVMISEETVEAVKAFQAEKKK